MFASASERCEKDLSISRYSPNHFPNRAGGSAEGFGEDLGWFAARVSDAISSQAIARWLGGKGIAESSSRATWLHVRWRSRPPSLVPSIGHVPHENERGAEPPRSLHGLLTSTCFVLWKRGRGFPLAVSRVVSDPSRAGAADSLWGCSRVHVDPYGCSLTVTPLRLHCERSQELDFMAADRPASFSFFLCAWLCVCIFFSETTV